MTRAEALPLLADQLTATAVALHTAVVELVELAAADAAAGERHDDLDTIRRRLFSAMVEVQLCSRYVDRVVNPSKPHPLRTPECPSGPPGHDWAACGGHHPTG